MLETANKPLMWINSFNPHDNNPMKCRDSITVRILVTQTRGPDQYGQGDLPKVLRVINGI